MRGLSASETGPCTVASASASLLDGAIPARRCYTCLKLLYQAGVQSLLRQAPSERRGAYQPTSAFLQHELQRTVRAAAPHCLGILCQVAQNCFERYLLHEPEHVGDAKRDAIAIELERLARAEDAGDDAQELEYLKCTLEAIAKVVLDLDGDPAPSNASFDTIVNKAHDLLAQQPGVELVHTTPFGNLATQARKMAVSMSNIRNNHGSGHGRARSPEVKNEMLLLAKDGSLLWARWALRRLDHFANGRPETLIRDLVGDPDGRIVFYGGSLTERLRDADLRNQEPRHARAIGAAVGQRAAQGTFVVAGEGVAAPAETSDLDMWPPAYRLGVAAGLLFGPEGNPSISTWTLTRALQVCLPLTEHPEDVVSLLDNAKAAMLPGSLTGEEGSLSQLRALIEHAGPQRPEPEPAAWARLSELLPAPGSQG